MNYTFFYIVKPKYLSKNPFNFSIIIYYIKLGKNSINCGKNVTKIKTINNVIINGIHSLTKSLISTWTIEQVRNIIEPNGGVKPPIIILTIMTIPK